MERGSEEFTASMFARRTISSTFLGCNAARSELLSGMGLSVINSIFVVGVTSGSHLRCDPKFGNLTEQRPGAEYSHV